MLPNRTVNVVEYQMPDHIDWIGVKFISDFSSSSTDVSPQTSGDANQNNADVNIDASDSLFSSFVHDRSTATVPNAADRPGEAIALQDNAVAHEDHAGSPNSFNDRTNEIPAAQNAPGHAGGEGAVTPLQGVSSEQIFDSFLAHGNALADLKSGLAPGHLADQDVQTNNPFSGILPQLAESLFSPTDTNQSGPVLVALESAPNGSMMGTVQTATVGGAWTVHYGSSGLQFNITYDASVNSAPAAFVSAIGSVIQWFQSHFNDAVTVNIDVGYGEVNGQSLGTGALGESLTYLSSYSYSALKNALTADATTSNDKTAVGTLPATSPAPHGGTFWISTAEQKAVKLLGPSSNLDGYVGFSSASNIFDYNESDGIKAGQYDFFSVVAHEFSEVMGRQTLDGGTIGRTSNSYEPLDLFHYSSNGVRDFSGTTAGYFSIDKGATNLNNFNTNRGGDFGDWAASAGRDAFLAISNSGVVNALSAADIKALDVLGWNLFA